MSKSEIDVLRAIAKIRRGSIDDVERASGIPRSTIASIAESLALKNLVKIERSVRQIYRTTEEGLKSLNSFPEEELLELLKRMGGVASIKEIEDLLGKERASIAIAWARRRGWARIEGGRIISIGGYSMERYRKALEKAMKGATAEELGLSPEELAELVRRKMLVKEEATEVTIEILENGLKVLEDLGDLVVISKLTRDIVIQRPRGIYIKPYNVEAEPARIHPAYRHFYVDFLEMLREIMLSLGFDEISDDLVVPELWNFDVLFQAQDHPAREIHDTLVVEGGEADLRIYGDLLERVSREHSRGWGYEYNRSIASRLVMRSQTTAATIKYLHYHREPPVRAFIIGRVFRFDRIDAKHLPEFHQLDGIAMEHDMSLRKLLGILTQITKALGFREVIFKPGYFPFTEPSVEGYVRIGDLGYVEIFGSGLFRPEVLRMAGVKHNVAAWGMGVDRLAMAYLAINDIRELYTPEIDKLRWHRVASYKAIH
ncbi:MAG TPA: phenylalanine--tRNA ligase subunit alpha [Sulfolobales archaeon]|nr:phenylalanine--tRNA ligase subunit alpha [Sulfolobales archaeon]